MMAIDVNSNPFKNFNPFTPSIHNTTKNNYFNGIIPNYFVKKSKDFKLIEIQSQYCQDSIFNNIDLNETIHSLKQKGISRNLNLPAQIIQEIRDLALTTPCHEPNNTRFSCDVSEKEQVMMQREKQLIRGIYDNTLLSCPTIKKLETDPTLLAIAATYLNAEPIHHDTQLWWSFAVESTLYERRQEAQRFYRATNNPRSLTFYFYLTNVDLCSNPHVCVLESHRKKKLGYRFLSKDYSLQDISKYYGYHNITSICGKAGLGFVEDARCFRKKSSPSSNDRLTLELKFAAKPRSI
ncbi:hypothetical protein [Coleofasciculus sp. F4-SAH-05]|uniref:hypothetical protein n=1 Tax=Coleofasciculus sp. F4-SAH-05 TaxID=3069525 RepID=UPI0032F5F900